MILGKDSENISASNKIRLLLSQLNIGYQIPTDLNSLQEFKVSENNILDAPEAIVYTRNAIVHSQIEKRKKLSEISFDTILETLQLYIWYIEMSLLRILEFEDKYINRCINTNYYSNGEEYVPWSKKETEN